jgi:hypothetical protein
VNGLGVAHVGVVVEYANDVATGSLHNTCTYGERHISDLMTVNTSDVNSCTCNVVEFTNIGTTDATISATINEGTGLANVIMQRHMIANVGHINAILGR